MGSQTVKSLVAVAILLVMGIDGSSEARRRKIISRPEIVETQDSKQNEPGAVSDIQGIGRGDTAVGPQIFDRGVELFYQNNHINAAAFLWAYMVGNPPGADRYEYAEFFFARCMEALGFTQAAMEYYFNVAKNRTSPELLPDALQSIENLSRRVPIDQEMIYMDLIYDSTFGYLSGELTDFVEYIKGWLDYRNGSIKWGQRHFSHIRPGSYYDYKAKYVQAVYELVKHNDEEALKSFEQILASDVEQTDVINASRQSIARLLFEQRKYEKAYEMYETIDAPIEKQASVFLEEAWTKYFQKDYRRSMGLLYALEAPAFYRYFNPEKFLIKALIYQNLCHYNVAKDAVAEFRDEYSEAIASIYDRLDLTHNSVILDAALQDPSIKELEQFQSRLVTELGRLDDFEKYWIQNRMLEHLKRIYELKRQQVDQAIRARIEPAVRKVAERLLEYEEQMNILEYEIGLSIYKRIKGAPSIATKEKQTIPYSDKRVYYEFDGEFWSDELHDLRFFIEDRCFGEERWE